ncbi:asparagine synthase (glutamine-hydrolyzing), partial [bacterium]|nr:asparagine synthase (glutamine-hydrolyzing) [bacterium]
MCGICGFIDKHSSLSDPLATLNAMCGTMVHRGPDDAGSFIHGRTALAMRRLSVIDLSTGHQPIHNEDKTVWTVFNGELYNFRTLRARLLERDHTFRTQSDTEVIVHAYEEYGIDFLKEIDGMFAIALYDTKKDLLILARDRAGEKPLYYANLPGGFVFGSEIKSLLKFPSVGKEIDPVSLQQFLLFSCIFIPGSIFRDIRKLPEGSFLMVQNGVAGEAAAYWSLSFSDPPERRTESEWIGMVDETLHQAVVRRLESDVPLGVFLSGGLDSSLVVAHMCRVLPPERVKTFSITLDDPAYDESKWSRWAARLMKTDHHEFQLSVDGMADVIDHVLANMDEPMADSSIIPTHVVSKLTREHVTVALAGDGGDEVFGGYPKYFAQRWAEVLRHVPPGMRRWLIEKPLSLLPSPDGSVLLGQNKIAAFFRGIDEHYALRNQLWVSAFQPSDLAALTGHALDPRAFDPVLTRAAQYRG